MAEQTEARYWAFISYSHKDAAFGRRLHRRLESYAVPRRLAGRKATSGPVPEKLVPIFRDREELPAANDLSTEVRAALQASRSLIVVCSPSAAASKWVSREIETFRELHPDRPILAAVRDGEPAECFPDALNGIAPDGSPIEPLAADFRRGRDGEQLGLLKLVAGIIGIGLDELVQRDAHRRNQRVTAVTAGALAGMVVMGVLTGYALNAQHEAERQRGEAEGLVKFMYTDLRYNLRGVGRLDLMNAVNQRALRYLDDEKSDLSPQSRGQRAWVLQAIGEDAATRGDLSTAAQEFEEAWHITDALLASAPDDPERILDHAQSEYWLGNEAYQERRLDRAKERFRRYNQHAARLASIAPHNPAFLRELAFSEGDLCSVDLQPPRDPHAALALCLTALKHMEEVKRLMPPSSVIDADIANRHSWLGSAYWALYDSKNALEQWSTQEQVLNGILKTDPFNMDRRSEWTAVQRLLARSDVAAGRMDNARQRLNKAAVLLDEMLAMDPSNKVWAERRDKIKSDLAKVPPERRPQ